MSVGQVYIPAKELSYAHTRGAVHLWWPAGMFLTDWIYSLWMRSHLGKCFQAPQSSSVPSFCSSEAPECRVCVWGGSVNTARGQFRWALSRSYSKLRQILVKQAILDTPRHRPRKHCLSYLWRALFQLLCPLHTLFSIWGGAHGLWVESCG